MNNPQLQHLPFQELRNTDVEKVGGKSASLGEMISQLSDVGVPVPGGVNTKSDKSREDVCHFLGGGT